MSRQMGWTGIPESPGMDPFSESEMRFVLSELIKASDADVNLLAEFIRSQGLRRHWYHILLPRGRTVDQCMRATERMLGNTSQIVTMQATQPQPSVPQPDFYSDPSYRPPYTPSLEINSPIPMKPPLSRIAPAQPPQTHQPRSPRAQAAVQTAANGFGMFPAKSSPMLSTEPPKRKRGRPPKAAKEAEALARGKPLGHGPLTPIAISPAPPARGVASPSPRVATPQTAPIYQLDPGSSDGPRTKRMRPSSADDRSQPRALPEHMSYASVAARDNKTPSIGNLVSAEPASNPLQARASPAAPSNYAEHTQAPRHPPR